MVKKYKVEVLRVIIMLIANYSKKYIILAPVIYIEYKPKQYIGMLTIEYISNIIYKRRFIDEQSK